MVNLVATPYPFVDDTHATTGMVWVCVTSYPDATSASGSLYLWRIVMYFDNVGSGDNNTASTTIVLPTGISFARFFAIASAITQPSSDTGNSPNESLFDFGASPDSSHFVVDFLNWDGPSDTPVTGWMIVEAFVYYSAS